MLDTIQSILILMFAGLAMLTGAGFVIFRQAVYAAISFAATVLSAAILYILLDAPYVAAATIVIYAGATIIIFLFVLMFAQHPHLQHYELKYSNLGPALVATIAMVLLLCYAVSTRNNVNSGITYLPMPPQQMAVNAPPAATSSMLPKTSELPKPSDTAITQPAPLPGPDMSVAALGRTMYTRYLWTIELAGTLLLIAACGAIAIAQREPSSSKSGASA